MSTGIMTVRMAKVIDAVGDIQVVAEANPETGLHNYQPMVLEGDHRDLKAKEGDMGMLSYQNGRWWFKKLSK
jgi:hypothetical protein